MSARMAAVAFASFALISAAGSAQSLGPPWLQAVSPNAITLRWYADDVPQTAAHAIASAHCAATARAAALAELDLHGSIEIATYRCE